MDFRMESPLNLRLRGLALRASRICLKSALMLLALAVITCNDVDGPEPIPDDPDTGKTDTTAARDSIPPQAITDALFSLNETTFAATLTWTAPYDDSIPEPVASYAIRYSHNYSAISNWDLGMPVFTPPDPETPGIVQNCSDFLTVERGKNLYAALKSVDEADNISELSNIAAIHIPGYTLHGRCIETISKQPVEGLEAAVLSGQIHRLETGADGTFEKNDLAKDIYLNIATGASPIPYHEFLQQMRLENDTTHTVEMIRYEPTLSGEYHSLLWLFKVLSRTTSHDQSRTLRKWKTTPIKCYIPSYINEHGVDYGGRALEAAGRWMNAGGWELFTFVDSPPDTGIVFEFRTAAEMGNLRGITEYSNGADLLPLLDTIAIADYLTDTGFVYRVCLHELGHAIRLGHVSTRSYIMYSGQPLPGDISQDELGVLDLLRSLPNNLPMEMYDDSAPDTQ
jgi:hypothetical protein